MKVVGMGQLVVTSMTCMCEAVNIPGIALAIAWPTEAQSYDVRVWFEVLPSIDLVLHSNEKIISKADVVRGKAKGGAAALAILSHHLDVQGYMEVHICDQ